MIVLGDKDNNAQNIYVNEKYISLITSDGKGGANIYFAGEEDGFVHVVEEPDTVMRYADMLPTPPTHESKLLDGVPVWVSNNEEDWYPRIFKRVDCCMYLVYGDNNDEYLFKYIRKWEEKP